MGCCTPNEVGPGPAAADPCKRVNYTLGMLLGVDDFVQESAYHGARRRELARELLGYGTVHGLQVVVEPDGDRGPRLRVMPGMAWLPSGTPVCVSSAQCANLNDWLAAHGSEVQVGSPAQPLTLYVVLSHAQCLTDNVPIPGEPCRDDSELMQPSRVADGFRLELRLAPPPQREEDAIRDFAAWLLDVPLAASSPPLTEQEFVDQLRAAAHAWLAPTSPPTSPPDFMLGAAPAGTSEELVTAALRLWTTELRPLWMARADCGCDAEPIAPRDDAVLLAELRIDLVAGSPHWQVSDDDGAVEQDESRRPFVLSLRMLQELITLHAVPDPGDAVVAETAFGQSPDGGVSLHYARADHTHGTPDAPPVPDLGGDLSGPVDDARIESLQGIPLVAGSPLVDGYVLTLQGGQWMPMALPAPPPPPTPAPTGAPTPAPTPTPGPTAAPTPAPTFAPTPAPTATPAPPPVDPQAVRRGNERFYEIAAAGQVRFKPFPEDPATVSVGPAYNHPQPVEKEVSGDTVRVAFVVKLEDADKYKGFCVKLTPILSKYRFLLYLRGPVEILSDTAIRFDVLVVCLQGDIDDAMDFAFQMEVSRWEED